MPLDLDYGAAIDRVFGPSEAEKRLLPGNAAEIRLKGSLRVAGDRDPDAFAKTLDLSGKTGLPTDVVERNKPEVNALGQRINLDYRSLLADTPNAAFFLSDPDNASIAQDDIPNLVEQEMAAGRLKEEFTFTGALADIAAAAVFARQDIGDLAAAYGPLATGTMTDEEAAALQAGFEARAKVLERGEASSTAERAVNLLGLPAAKIVGSVAGIMAEGPLPLELAAAGATAGATTGNPALVTLGALSGFGSGVLVNTYLVEAADIGLELRQLRGENGERLEPELIQTGMVFGGVANMMLEGLSLTVVLAPFRKRAKAIFKDGFKEAMKTPSGRQALLRFGKFYVAAVTTETATEVLQEAVSAGVAEIQKLVSTGEFETTTGEEFFTRLLDVGSEVFRGMLVAGAIVPGIGLAGGTVGRVADRQKAKRIQKGLTDLGKTILASRMAERSPERAARFLQQIIAKDAEVYISSEDIATYAQEIGVDPAELAQELGVGDQFLEAEATGGDIVAPAADFIAATARTEHFEPLVQHVRFNPRDMSAAQAEAVESQSDAIIEQERARRAELGDRVVELEASSERVFKNVREQLEKAGHTAEVAENQALLFREFFRTLAANIEKKTGTAQDPFEMFEREGVQIRRGVPEDFDAIVERARAENETPAVETQPAEVDLAAAVEKGRAAIEALGAAPTPEAVMAALAGIPDAAFRGIPLAVEAAEIAAARTEETAKVEKEAATAPDEQVSALLGLLADLGIDITQATNAEIRAAIEGVESAETDSIREFNQAAFSGSPAQHERFSTDFIGTGEGALAFGWGLYFSERKEIADFYREQQSRGRAFNAALEAVAGFMRDHFGVDPVVDFSTEARHDVVVDIVSRLSLSDGDIAKQVYNLNPGLRKFGGKTTRGPHPKIEAVVRDVRGTLDKKRGRTFKVDIPEDDTLLLWDKPLSEQPEKVLAALDKEIPGVADDQDRTGADLYHALVEDHERNILRENKRAPSDAKEFASKELAALGIDGIKYLDGGSRSDGDGTFNFVIFDDKLIKILEFDQSDEGSRRGSITFGDIANQEGLPEALRSRETTIKLFEKSDLSTVLHETGHFFLEVMGRVVESGQATPEMEADYRALLKSLGVNSRSEIGTEQHEQFAEMFEIYLFEGKAPSPELQSAFARFKAWLSLIYRDIRATLTRGAKINDEVRSILDRLLATEEAIEQAQANGTYTLQFRTAEEAAAAGMDEKQYARYLERADKAVEEAKGAVLAKHLKEVAREQERFWREGLDQEQERILAGLQDDPLWNAIQALTKGKNVNGDQVEPIKLDRAAFIERFGAEKVKDLPRGIWSTEKNKVAGQDVDAAAAVLGYRDGAQLIDVLVNRPRDEQGSPLTLKAFVKQGAERVMRDRHGELTKDDLADTAQEALTSDAVGEIIEDEIRALNRALPADQQVRAATGRQLSVKQAKEIAKRVIGEKKVTDLRPHQYEAQAQKHAKAAVRSMVGGNLAEAAASKVQQIINHYLAREAFSARDKAGKQVARLRKYNKKSVRKRIAIDYMLQLDQLLESYDLRNVGKAERKRIESLAAWAEKEKAAGQPVSIDTRIIERAEQTPWDQLTVDELQGLADTAANIAKLGRDAGDAAKEAHRRFVNEGVIVGNRNTKPVKREFNPARSSYLRENLREGIHRFAYLKKARTFIEKLDGFEKGGWFDQHILTPIRDAEVRRENRIHEEGTLFFDLIKKHYGKGTIIKVFGRSIDLPFEKLTGRKTEITISGRTYNKEERLVIALNSGNQGNIDALLDQVDDRVMSEDHLNSILRTLDEKDWAFVQDAWDYINKFWPEIAKLHESIHGYAPQKVEAHPVILDGVEVAKGGYYPLHYESKKSHNVESNQIHDTLQEQDFGKFAPAQTKHGFRETRVGSGGAPVRYSLSVVSSHVSTVLNDLELYHPIVNARKILRHPDMLAMLEDRLGVEAVAQLDMWLKDTAVAQMQDGGAGQWFSVRNLRTSVTVGAMGWKMATSLIQISGFSHSVVDLGHKWMAVGLLKTADFARRGKNPHKWVNDKSKFMEQRARSQQRDVADALRRAHEKGNLVSSITDTLFWPIIFMQRQVDTPTWLGGYNKALSEGRSEQEAIKIADGFVDATQGSGLMSTLSAFERGTWSQNTRLSEFVKLWGAFYSYFNVKLNLVTRKHQAFKAGKISAGRLAADYITLFWLETVIGELMYSTIDSLFGDEPDEWEPDESWGEVLWYHTALTAGTLAASFPGFREISSALQGYGAAPAPSRSLETIARTIGAAGKVLTEPEKADAAKIVKSTLAGINVVSPVKYPVSQINIAIDAFARADRGEDVPFVDFILRPPRN